MILKAIIHFFIIGISFLLFAGCASVTPPTPEDIITHPLGTETLRLGMTKEEVLKLWGEPDRINYVKDEKRWAGEREEWVYKARYTDFPFPMNAGYLSKTKKLYFDGNNLTTIIEE